MTARPRSRVPSAHATLAWLACAALFGCVPDFVDNTTLVTVPRVVAVRATPAEAAEDAQVTLDALIVARTEDPSSALEWSLCVDRKPLSELGPVSTRCLASPTPGDDIAEPVDPAPPVVATLPSDACELFGPERPEPQPGQPAGRPVDPDVTGGFYQPVLAWLGAAPVLGGVRLACPLTGASPDDTREFNASYHANTNPAPLALEAVHTDGTSETLSDGAVHAFTPGEHVALRVSLPACEPEAESCGGAESYVVFDSLAQEVVPRTESLVVSWYATNGDFSEPRTEVESAGDDGSPTASNTWTLPTQSGAASLWAVARDDRGGAGWLSGTVNISP
jgi:hypothetical protein